MRWTGKAYFWGKLQTLENFILQQKAYLKYMAPEKVTGEKRPNFHIRNFFGPYLVTGSNVYSSWIFCKHFTLFFMPKKGNIVATSLGHYPSPHQQESSPLISSSLGSHLPKISWKWRSVEMMWRCYTYYYNIKSFLCPVRFLATCHWQNLGACRIWEVS